jgi:hypothetical protein
MPTRLIAKIISIRLLACAYQRQKGRRSPAAPSHVGRPNDNPPCLSDTKRGTAQQPTRALNQPLGLTIYFSLIWAALGLGLME